MKCAVHPDVDATGFCRNCGKPLCPQCTRDVQGALYCEDCLAQTVTGALGARTAGKPPSSRPAAALILGFVPGLGAVYNGEYIKALVQVFIFGGIIAALNANVPDNYEAFLGIALGCFYLYMPVDSFRVAQAREVGKPQPDLFPLGEVSGNKPVGALVLIGLGFFLLLANFGLFDWQWFSKLWPLGLIALGAWILFNRMHRDS